MFVFLVLFLWWLCDRFCRCFRVLVCYIPTCDNQQQYSQSRRAALMNIGNTIPIQIGATTDPPTFQKLQLHQKNTQRSSQKNLNQIQHPNICQPATIQPIQKSSTHEHRHQKQAKHRPRIEHTTNLFTSNPLAPFTIQQALQQNNLATKTEQLQN